MNLAKYNLTPIHHSEIKPGERYLLKFAMAKEGVIVEYLELDADKRKFLLLEGRLVSPGDRKPKFTAGQTFSIPKGVGEFYEFGEEAK